MKTINLAATALMVLMGLNSYSQVLVKVYDPEKTGTEPRITSTSQNQLSNDLQERLNRLTVLIKPEHLQNLTQLETPSGNLTLFAPIAKILTSATKDTTPLAEDKITQACLNLQAIDLARIKSEFQGCSQTSPSLIDDVFGTAFLPCRDVHRSEDYSVGARKQATVDSESQSSLLGLMEVAAVAWKVIPMPKSIWTEEHRSQFREIIIKLRAPTLHRNINKQFDKFDRFVTAAKSCGKRDQAEILVSSLRSDLYAARARVNEVVQKGQAQAKADREAVLARGRYRDERPNTALTDSDIRFVSVWLGGWYWRNRGGGPIRMDSTQKARYFHTKLPMETLAREAGAANYAGGIGTSHFMNLIFKGWATSMDMGTNSETIQEDTIAMSERGIYQLQETAQNLGRLGYDVSLLKLGGAQMGACYNFAKEKLEHVYIHPEHTPPYTGFIEGFTAWGEFCSGMALTLGTAEALLNGQRFEN